MRMKQSSLMVVTALALAGAGCATNTGKGAGIGAGAGAVVGAGVGAIAGGTRGAVVGATVGAATGGATGAIIGRYMDNQQKELERVKSAKVERQGDELVVKFSSAILFDVDKTELKPESKKDLGEFSAVLKTYKDTNLVIEGHTDSTGSNAYNKDLSERRAQSVIAFLESQGVAAARLKGVGFGEEKPAATNDTPEGRQQNRRVQINIAANEELKRQDAQAASTPAASAPAATK